MENLIGYYSKSLQVANNKTNINNNKLSSPTKTINEDFFSNITQKNKIDTIENRELLQRLFKEAFEPKLSILEKKSKNISSTIKDTFTLTKYITNLSIRMNKQIKEKLEKKRQEALSKQNKSKNKSNRKLLSPRESNKNSNSKLRTTPGNRRSNSRPYLDNNNYCYSEKKNFHRSKSNMTAVRSRRMTLQGGNNTLIRKKMEKSKSFTNVLDKENNKENHFRRGSLNSSRTDIRPSKTNLTTYNTKLNSRSNNTNRINTMLNSSKQNQRYQRLTMTKNSTNSSLILNKSYGNNNGNSSKRKTTPFRSKMFPCDNSNLNDTEEDVIDDINLSTNNNNKNRKRYINKNKYKYKPGNKTFDYNLDQDDLYINNEDSLLVLPTHNNEQTEQIFGISPKLKLNSFNIVKNINSDIINNIYKFLLPIDTLPLNNFSKKFRKYSISYFIYYLQQEKIFFEKSQKDLQIKDPPPDLNIINLSLSNGTEKAIELLNDSLLNRLFNDEVVTNVDILLIYKIFFQFIGHPFALINKKEEFWEKCRNFFLEKTQGRTGDFINGVIKNKKLDLSGKNLYRVYKLVSKNLNKILPAYFCKICGTTGLFAFFVKDILDFLGFTNDKKMKKRAYWTYSNIILAIKDKEEYLKSKQD